MTVLFHSEIFILLIVLVSSEGNRVSQRGRRFADNGKTKSKFSLSSFLDSTFPALKPIVTPGSNKCDAVKQLFGLTFEQIQGKNATDFNRNLSIDLITVDGTIKHNLTENIARTFNNENTMVILIHGFLESSDGWMVQAVAPEFVKKKGYDVFALDGSNVMTVDYLRSSTYVRFMGIQLGDTLNDMISKGFNPENIYLVGHSLGAHIAGIAGKRVFLKTGEKVGRITGLDPAGPCFTAAGLEAKLHKDDAEYVDVIHTNGGFLGVLEPILGLLSFLGDMDPITNSSLLKKAAKSEMDSLMKGSVAALAAGHKDFYPNGGLRQPGCYLSTCDHSRAWELYAESINNPRLFPARQCSDWISFQNISCIKNEIAYMGFNSKSGSQGNYYLATLSSSPFGLGTSKG